ncbi:MAG: hypothetical protein N2440_06215 [Actinobacteria bacterium]|nr:hypothetical protein [Actinomycetota bacterium]
MRIRKIIFLSIIFLLLSSFTAIAGDRPGLLNLGNLSSNEVGNGSDLLFARDSFYIFHSDSLSKKLIAKKVNLEGKLDSTSSLKGLASGEAPFNIRGSSDGTNVAVVWMENGDNGTWVFSSVSTDGTTFNKNTIFQGQNVLSADIAISDDYVIVAYVARQNNLLKVFVRRSSDGGLSFSIPETIFNLTDDIKDAPYFIDVELSESGEIGAAVSLRKYFDNGTPDPPKTYRVYYTKSSLNASLWSTPTLLFENADEAPNDQSSFNVLSLNFDDNNLPWIAWCSKNLSSGKIWWIRRNSSGWTTSASSFLSANSSNSSVRLVRNKALFSPGLMLVYTKGSKSYPYYRFARSDGFGDESRFSSTDDQNTGFLASASFYGHTALLMYGMPDVNNNQSQKLFFERILKPGETGRLRYEIWSEDFENSDVNTDSYWKITTEAGAANAFFKETTYAKNNGLKSLWSVGSGNVTYKYPPNTATTAKLKFFAPEKLNYELNFSYLFARGDDPDDLMSCGFSSFPLTLPPTISIWKNHSIYSSGSENTVVFRMVSDEDTETDKGLFIDDIKLYGYKLRRPTLNIQQVFENGVGKLKLEISNYDGNEIYVFRSNPSSNKFNLIATSTSNIIYDIPDTEGYYTYYVKTSDGIYESPSSEAKVIYFRRMSIDIQISGVLNNQSYSTPVTIIFNATDPVYNITTVNALLNQTPIVSGTIVEAENKYTLVVSARNQAGFESSKTVNFVIDYTKPKVSISGVSNGDIYNAPVNISFEATDTLSGIALVSATLNGKAILSGSKVSSDGVYLLQVVAKDRASNTTTSTVRFTVDFTPPSVTINTMPNYSSSNSTKTFFNISYSATDNLSGISSFDLEYRPNYSSTFVRLLSSPTQTAYTFSGSQGLTYYFRVRAKDKAGNISPWSAVKSTSIPYDDTNSLFTLSSGWKKASGPYRFLGSSSYTTLKGKYFKLKQGIKLYSVKEVAIIVTKSPYGGKANVYLNGKLIKTIDTYASKNTYRVPIIIKTYTTPTTIYDLRVVTTGTKNTYSKGYFVDIDGVGVRR